MKLWKLTVTRHIYKASVYIVYGRGCSKKRLNMMNKRFGGKIPTGTPSLALSTVVVVASLLGGASVVHNLYKPDLVSSLLLECMQHVR